LNTAIDNKQITCGLFLDFSKVFNTVNHDNLLSKLYTYGIGGTSFKWVKSYLCKRTQFIKIDEIESSMETISCGVLQGSTLGHCYSCFILMIHTYMHTYLLAPPHGAFQSQMDKAQWIKTRPQHRELRALLLTISVWVL